MAVLFPSWLYGADSKTTMEDTQNVRRDVMQDGTPRGRELGTSVYREIMYNTVPLTTAEQQALASFLRTYRTIELDVVVLGETFRGYIWSDTDIRKIGGDLWRVKFKFRGAVI